MMENANIEKHTFGGVRNSSPAFAGSPFGSANKRVSGFGLRLRPNPLARTSDTRRTLSDIVEREGMIYEMD
jgi:hypothetical protein